MGQNNVWPKGQTSTAFLVASKQVNVEQDNLPLLLLLLHTRDGWGIGTRSSMLFNINKTKQNPFMYKVKWVNGCVRGLFIILE
jgi:hypothetical protein